MFLSVCLSVSALACACRSLLCAGGQIFLGYVDGAHKAAVPLFESLADAHHRLGYHCFTDRSFVDLLATRCGLRAQRHLERPMHTRLPSDCPALEEPSTAVSFTDEDSRLLGGAFFRGGRACMTVTELTALS
eukprot:GHVU01227567.1.p1 GENE.GHVU01227567.1~~GHVU01227567.1.p1  ORF type:complete len:132 (+),score=6.46 GHVU01227567.1:579-974(+)